jgi:hypothetical protein
MRKAADKKNSIKLNKDITAAVKQPEIVNQIRHSGRDKGGKETFYTKFAKNTIRTDFPLKKCFLF